MDENPTPTSQQAMSSKPKRGLPKPERHKRLWPQGLKIRHGNGAAVVVRAGESPVHGEGRQEIDQYRLWKGA